MATAGERGRLLVVGTGLIGTSVALAAQAGGYEVWLDDVDSQRLGMALAVAAGSHRGRPVDRIDLAVAAVPPATVAPVVHELIASGVAATVTHVASVQYRPQQEIEALDPGCRQYVGSHPVAGRERSGPHHAAAELFAQRPWIVCPTTHSAEAAVAAVAELASSCGGVVATMSALEHDRLFAQLSHVPQLVASALAGSLSGLDRGEVALAGTGLRDTSRLADSDAALWAEIIAANPIEVARALHAVLDPLLEVAEALAGRDPEAATGSVRDLVARGRAGRDLMAGKHGQVAVRWATVSVVVPDEPGALARLLGDAAQARVNVEDIRVDHSPGQPLGIVELDVAPAQAHSLESALLARSWAANASPPVPGQDG